MTSETPVSAHWNDLTSLSYPEDYPTNETLTTLYDEIDFPRACQCYIWAMPTVALNEINVCQNRDLGVGLNEIALFQHFVGPESVGLTPNSTTIYALSVVDLVGAGPMVVDIPEGAYGVIDDLCAGLLVTAGHHRWLLDATASATSELRATRIPSPGSHNLLMPQ